MSTANSSLPEVISNGSIKYEELRTRFFNSRIPDTKPAEIYCPKTTPEVAAIIQQAKKRRLKVGVRSGGLLFPCTSLIPDGVLADTLHLNAGIEYDSQTQLVSFPPAARSKDLADALIPLGRFFPFGHSPTVAAGGFCLAGGQGWFMRGWGFVTPNGEVIRASKTENPDVFWAARGSGQCFFGVVTRFWGKTIPARRLFERVRVFDCTDSFAEVVHWVFDVNDRTQKEGVEIAAATFRPDKEVERLGDEVGDTRIFMGVSSLAFTDSIDEARRILNASEDVPEGLQKSLVVTIPLEEKSWDQLFEAQDRFTPAGNGERWQCDSILNNPDIPRSQLIEAIQPALCDLPSRRSVGCIYIGDYTPDEKDQAISLPHQYCISTMTCWKDPTWDERMRRWMYEVYSRAAPVSCGQYIADLDAKQRMTPVMSENALDRFLKIRQKWDSEDMFTTRIWAP
ncbi:hypothetical protein ASPWEDRAFT_25537 [Aspergillus wentii DTO 134E9]|uniref:FAD-binding PCMH-type domain-containing protein n=1 Tax=Aspergillus wentii DTO 134E9 TaxID=1073089 RepID=A0A1L9RXR8_ASPWE|nr:uncharacterized protein ASPWEDRAFT_25537 [Aspergillus wentii DTO 134E9]OJJ39736.1 hypothetical protein ASPWEDRAFT_25537 [Aspergillus wentii DTO 134E9]